MSMAYPTGYRDPQRTGDLAQDVGCFLCRPPLRCPLCGGAHELHPIGGAVLADAVTEMLSDIEQLTCALLSGTHEGKTALLRAGVDWSCLEGLSGERCKWPNTLSGSSAGKGHHDRDTGGCESTFEGI